MKKNFLICWIFLGLITGLAGTGFAADLEVRAYLDKTVVGLNQQFTLNVELAGKGAGSASNPELPNMGDFAAYLGSGSSQNIQFVNGKMSSTKVISYHFQATAEGEFQIDPVMVKAGKNEFRTEPITLSVQKAASSSRSRGSVGAVAPVQGEGPAEGDLFIRTLRSKKEVYQNEQVIITYKIYTRVDVSSFGYAQLPGTAGFWVEEVPVGRQPQTSKEIIDGKQYTIATIKKMTLFPMTSGEKIIDPLSVECEIRMRRRSRDIFDDFFSDPFGKTVRKVVQSKPLKINVLPLPAEGKPQDFSGAVGQYTLSAHIDKKSVKTNEAVSYKIVLSGKGNIRTLPEPKPQFSSDFEVYPPKTGEQIDRSNGIVSGTKTFEYVLVPRVAGRHTIRPVTLSVFEPEAGTYQILRTKAFDIDVAQGKEMASVIHAGLSKEEVKLVGQDIRFIKTEPVVFREMDAGAGGNLIFWTIFILPLMALAGAFVYRGHLDRLHEDMAYARDLKASRFARKRLARAKSSLDPARQKEFYAEVGKALMGFLGDKLNISEAGMITDQVIAHLKKRKVSEETLAVLSESLSICDMQRFAPSEATVDEMQLFYDKTEKVLMQLNKEMK